VEVADGEPLAQEETPELVSALLAAGHLVLVETSGALPIEVLDRRTHIIMDVKWPGLGHERAHALAQPGQGRSVRRG